MTHITAVGPPTSPGTTPRDLPAWRALGNSLAEDEAEQGDTAGPSERADGVIDGENAVAHAADTRHDRGKGPDGRQEAGEKNGFRAVALEK